MSRWLQKPVLPITFAWLLIMLSWLGYHSEGVGGRPLTMIWGHDPGVFDPHRTSNPIAYDIFRHVCEPLFYEDLDGTVRGLLAEDDIQYDDSGRRVTVRLRPSVTFHDQTPLNAAIVKASFERLQHFGVSPLIGDLRDVMIERIDDRTLVFILPEPDYEFVRLTLANVYAAIVLPSDNSEAESGLVTCTGPYQFAPDLYRPAQSLTLINYPSYHWPPAYFTNRDAAHIPQMHFIFEAERERRLDLLLNDTGCLLSLSQEHLNQVGELSRFRLHEASGGVTYLGFNFLQPRWQDIRVRQAVAMALDKAALANLGPFAVAQTPLSPDAIGYDPRLVEESIGYHPEQSRQLLTQAHFNVSDEVVLLIPESNTYRELAAAVIAQLTVVGLEQIRVREMPRSEILTQRQDFDLLLFDYAWGDYTALSIFLGPGPRNLLNYPDEKIAELIQRARATEDVNARQELISQAQRNVLGQAIWQPLLVRNITLAVDGECMRGERQISSGILVFHDANTYFPH